MKNADHSRAKRGAPSKANSRIRFRRALQAAQRLPRRLRIHWWPSPCPLPKGEGLFLVIPSLSRDLILCLSALRLAEARGFSTALRSAQNDNEKMKHDATPREFFLFEGEG